ncbi:MAG: von Willebrand factor type A domain-containing protein [Chthoniobacteraceae bacterium]
MNPEIDDPILTAYALGELNAQERAAVEARLAGDAEARRYVEETRAFAGELAGLLKATPAANLTPEQKESILVEAQAPNAGGKVIPFSRWVVPLGLAASVAAALVLTIDHPQKRGNFFAQNESVIDTTAPAKKPLQSPVLDAKHAAEQAALAQVEVQKLQAQSILQAQVKAAGVKKLLADADASSNEGKYDEAYGKYEQALNLDPYNVVARKAEEKITSDQAKLASNDYNHTRAPILAQVDKEWIEPVRQFNLGQPGSSALGYSTATGAVSSVAPASPATAGGVAKDASVDQLTVASFADRAKSVALSRAYPTSEVVVPSTVAGLPGLAQREPGNTEAYDRITDNEFLAVHDQPLSTFSIDVDTAAYANVRRFLDSGTLPPKDAVRIEELLNYFEYDYPQPKGEDPFSVNVEVARAPWNAKHLLAKIGLKGREIAPEQRPPMNLVFLLDVSGSMDEPNKLPLVRQSMKLLVERLKPEDRVAIVVYAGASGMALPSTPASHKKEIEAAIDSLTPGGSTNGAAGIQLAYDIAKANFIKDGVNRVIQCTDGDFNVGVTDQGDLLRLIEEKAKSGVFLTELGFGMGNYKDSTLEKLADKGNGNYGYVDTEREAKKLLVDQLGGTLVTIAKDVKIQVEFNPAQVGSYRLIGYENRLLAAQDFNDDKKDAGEIGAGHTVTALYELTPVGDPGTAPGIDPLKYHAPESADVASPALPDELMTVKLRYKQPDGETSRKIEQPVPGWQASISERDGKRTVSKDFQFAAAVAEFGMLLRESPYKGDATWKSASDLAENGLGPDPQGYRHEFLKLIQRAQQIGESQ